jgi:hypothetical protein
MTYLQYLRQYAFHIGCVGFIFAVSVHHREWVAVGITAAALIAIGIGSWVAYNRKKPHL